MPFLRKNIDIDNELWKEFSILAISLGLSKKEALNIALKQVIEDGLSLDLLVKEEK
jgi:antitoxin component of RelBE/YafQ-DinJ toxin-antitoxin module